MDQPEMLPFLDELRKLLDSYPDRYAVGETYLATPEKTASYCGADRLHAAFSFDFTSYTSEVAAALRFFSWNPRWIAKQIMAREKVFASNCFPTTVMSNHDLPRAVSRYIRGEDDRMAKVITTLLLTLRGTPYIYQGEEIGMRDIPLRYKEIVDPPGRKYWPLYPGRDGCRSPMQWDATHQAGFTSGKPWIKVHNNYQLRNVAAQVDQPGSLLTFTRRLVDLRKNHAPLYNGDYIPVESSRHVLAYVRQNAEEAILIICNFSRKQQSFTLPDGVKGRRVLLTTSRDALLSQDARLFLKPFEIRILLLESRWNHSLWK
jgi:alpha-glucosidase